MLEQMSTNNHSTTKYQRFHGNFMHLNPKEIEVIEIVSFKYSASSSVRPDLGPDI
jgi:hypothetical protein